MSGMVAMQESRPSQEQRAGGKQCVTRSVCREKEALRLRRHEGSTSAGGELHSEEGVCAGGIPILVLWVESNSSSLAS